MNKYGPILDPWTMLAGTWLLLDKQTGFDQ